jgi:serine/threonine-protein kinase
MRQQRRARNFARRSSGALQLPSPASSMESSRQMPVDRGAVYEAAGTHADKVRNAGTDRDEILRLVNSLPDREQQQVAEVPRSANALHERIQALAISLADLDRNVVNGGVDSLESEIARLEEQANPLERGSEERVRRLAYLKRQRRGMKDLSDRRSAVAAKLETCAIALRQLKLDVLRLRAGSQTHQRVTSLALEAIAMAQNVDNALYVADELADATRSPARSSARQSARPG